ncbi:WD40 repeat domain-containing protein [Tundrisphaera sp. TA3]|uniref:WD40 repeat domain-containing protein n=1 Tax=Tundrisphaera sp. TA3 TaxID=3435775 RepID=UPI003EC086EE
MVALVLHLSYEQYQHATRGRNRQYELLAGIRSLTNVAAVAISGDGRLIVLANYDGCIRLFRCEGPAELPPPPKQRGRAIIDLSPDGRMLAISGQGPRVLIWSIDRGEVALEIDAGEVESPRVKFSPDGKLLATVDGPRGVVEMWDLRSGLLNGRIRGPREGVKACEFSPDGRVMALAGRDGSVALHAVAGGLECWRVQGQPSLVMCLAFSPDGSRLASASSLEGCVRLWTVADGRPVGTIGERLVRIRAMGFSRQGTLFVSTAEDGSLSSYHVASRRRLTKQQVNAAVFTELSLAMNCDRLVTGHDDGMVRLWDTSRIVESMGDDGPLAEEAQEESGVLAEI